MVHFAGANAPPRSLSNKFITSYFSCFPSPSLLESTQRVFFSCTEEVDISFTRSPSFQRKKKERILDEDLLKSPLDQARLFSLYFYHNLPHQELREETPPEMHRKLLYTFLRHCIIHLSPFNNQKVFIAVDLSEL